MYVEIMTRQWCSDKETIVLKKIVSEMQFPKTQQIQIV